MHGLISHLTSRLQAPPPHRAYRANSPELCYGRHFGPPAHNARPAAVIAAFFPEQDRWIIPLTLRPQEMLDHAGQICLPGGSVEDGETLEECAVREFEEELGFARQRLRVLGQLNPIYIFASNYFVTPFVAIGDSNAEFVPNPAEVAEIIPYDIATLLDPQSRRLRTIRRKSLRFRTSTLSCGERFIWGATCVILGELAELLRQHPPK